MYNKCDVEGCVNRSIGEYEVSRHHQSTDSALCDVCASRLLQQDGVTIKLLA